MYQRCPESYRTEVVTEYQDKRRQCFYLCVYLLLMIFATVSKDKEVVRKRKGKFIRRNLVSELTTDGLGVINE